MKLELEDDLLDLCIVKSLDETLECFELGLEDPNSSIFSMELEAEHAEIKKHIEAFKLVRGWYSVPSWHAVPGWGWNQCSSLV